MTGIFITFNTNTWSLHNRAEGHYEYLIFIPLFHPLTGRGYITSVLRNFAGWPHVMDKTCFHLRSIWSMSILHLIQALTWEWESFCKSCNRTENVVTMCLVSSFLNAFGQRPAPAKHQNKLSFSQSDAWCVTSGLLLVSRGVVILPRQTVATVPLPKEDANDIIYELSVKIGLEIWWLCHRGTLVSK